MIAGLAGGPINDYVTGQNVYNLLQDWGLTPLANIIDWQSLEGWRIAFFAVGLPGLFFALILAFTMKEPPRGYTDPPEAVKPKAANFGQVLGILKRKPTFVHVVIGAAIASFAGYGIGHFVPAYFIRIHGLSLTQAALYYSLILGLSGATGVFLSGYLADRLGRRYPKALSFLPVIGMTASVPLYVFGFMQDTLWLTMPPLVVAALLHYFYLGPMYAVLGGVVDSRMRATSVAIGLFFVNLVGLAFGPSMAGITSTFIKSRILGAGDAGLTLEACKSLETLGEAAAAACNQADASGLQYAIVIFACLYLWAALHYLIAGKTLQRDMIALPT